MRSVVLAIACVALSAALVSAQPPRQGGPPGGPPGQGGPGGRGPDGQGGQRPNAPARDARVQETRSGTAVLRGVVLTADSGTPIRRAQVRIAGAGTGPRVAATDEQGRFELRELPAGRYTVTASKAGYVAMQLGQRRPSETPAPIDIADAQVLDKLVISLPRGSVISGRITDEFGEPVANATVQAMRFGFAAGARRLMPGGQNGRDTTDDQGYFRLFGLSPGEYVVSAILRAGMMQEIDTRNPDGETPGYAPTYFPGTPSANEAQRVTLAVGQEQTGVSFALAATRLVRVTGAVLNSQGAPVTSGAVVLGPPPGLLGGNMMATASGRIDASGQFRILNVAPGRYVAQVRTVRERGQSDAPPEFGRADITVGAEDLHGVVIATALGARISGQVVTDTSTPPSFSPQQMQIAARGADPENAPPAAGGAARLNADWTFELTNLFGPRLFRVNPPQGWYLKQITLDGQDITDAAVELPPGQTFTGLQIVLTQKTTELNGRVIDTTGKVVPDATVLVFPADDEKWTYQSRFIRATRPDAQGNFQIRGLPPLDGYLVVAVQGLEDGQAGDPEFLDAIRERATALTLDDGEVKAIDLRPQSR